MKIAVSLADHGRALKAVVQGWGFEVVPVAGPDALRVLLDSEDPPRAFVLHADSVDQWSMLGESRNVDAEARSLAVLVLQDVPDTDRIARALTLGARYFMPTKVVAGELAQWLLEETSGAPRSLVRGFSVANFSQMVETEGKDALIQVIPADGGDSGFLAFLGGELCDAVCGERRGDEAAITVLGWEGAAIEMRPLPLAPWARRVSGSVAALSLEAMRRNDEAALASSTAEAASAPVLEPTVLGAPPDPVELAREALEQETPRLSAEELRLLGEAHAWLRAGRSGIPVMPSTYVRLLDLLRDPEVCIQDIAELVTQDQSLSVTVLRFANSALLAATGEAVTVHDAVVRLGVRALRGVILGVAMEATVVKGDPNLEKIWRESIACAKTCALVSNKIGRGGDEAFLVGLLHMLHKMVFVSACRDRRAQAGDSILSSKVLDLLASQFFDSAFDEIASKWQLPDSVVGPIRGLVAGTDRTSVLYFARGLLDVTIASQIGSIDWHRVSELYELCDHHHLSHDELDACLVAATEHYTSSAALTADVG